MVSFRTRLATVGCLVIGMGWVLGLGGGLALGADTGRGDLVDRWLERRKGVRTWSAEFTQTRTFKALTHPLVTRGRVWFAAPDQFRWELGEPVQSVALRQAEVMVILYPPVRRAERYALGREGPWQHAVTLLEAGFPESRAQWERSFRVTRQSEDEQQAVLWLEPRSAAARRWLSRLQIVLNHGDLEIRSAEMAFADGSTLRNEFTGSRVNPELEEALFSTRIDPDYQVVEPRLEGRR